MLFFALAGNREASPAGPATPQRNPDATDNPGPDLRKYNGEPGDRAKICRAARDPNN